jgi:hypothetical protein
MKIIRIYPNHIFGLLIMIICVGCEKKEFQISAPYYPTQNLVSYFKFDDGYEDSLNYMKVLSGSGTFIDGKKNKAILFTHGQNVKYDKSSFTPNADKSHTIAYWVKIGKNPNIDAVLPYPFIRCNDFIAKGSRESIGHQVTMTLAITYIGSTENKWSHIVSTFDGKIFKFYINGEIYESKTKSNDALLTSTELYFGNESVPFFLNFSLDEMLIYNRVLTFEEITRIYNFNR